MVNDVFLKDMCISFRSVKSTVAGATIGFHDYSATSIAANALSTVVTLPSVKDRSLAERGNSSEKNCWLLKQKEEGGKN